MLEPIVRKAGIRPVARLVGIPHHHFIEWFQGKRRFGPKQIERFIEALGCELVIVDGDGNILRPKIKV